VLVQRRICHVLESRICHVLENKQVGCRT